MKTFHASITFGVLAALSFATAQATDTDATGGVWWKNAPLYQQAQTPMAMPAAPSRMTADESAFAVPWWTNAPLTAHLFDSRDQAKTQTQLSRVSADAPSHGM